MRVLLTTDTIGGVWTFTHELTEQLLERGHSVALVSFGRLPSTAQLACCTSIADAHPLAFAYQASSVPLEWMQENKRAFAEGAKVLARIVTTFRPDVLHSNQFCWGALTLDVPIVITAHSDVLSWSAAVKPEVLQGSSWLSCYCDLVQRGLRSADAIAAPTAWMRDALRANFHVPSRFDVIYNGRSIRQHRGHQQREMRAVSVGRLWDPAKGISTLLEIEPAMPILVAGDDSFEGAGIAPGTGITSLGSLAEDALLRLFNESRVYVAASLYEPFGLAPLEAALCGCAIIARDLDSLREVWADDALYFRNAAELEALLRALTADEARLQRAQNASSRRARTLTAERMVSNYLDLYEKVATRSVIGCVPCEEITAYVA